MDESTCDHVGIRKLAVCLLFFYHLRSNLQLTVKFSTTISTYGIQKLAA